MGPVGLAWRPAVLLWTLAGLVAAIAVGAVGIAVGASSLTPWDVLRTLVGAGTERQELVVLDWRMPRALGGLAAGAALGVAGALTQTFARNPLATPDIIGVTSGASAGAVLAIAATGGTYEVSVAVNTLGIPGAALLGGVVAAAVVYGLSWRSGIDSYRLVLVGLGVTAICTALTSYLMVRAQISDANQAAAWLVGSLGPMTWDRLLPLLIACAVLLPVSVLLSAGLAIGQFGDDAARGLGLPLELHRLATLVVAVLLAVAAVAAAGPIAFVAFVVPQVARRLTRVDRPPLVLSGLLGGVLVMLSDLLGRTVVDWEIPVGLVTTLVGAPYLILLLLRHRREANA
ncbi:iron chelate uptake ABC transporter family permease subunit [Nakamurella sp. YIM 132087]|uniref:Iron chelate uptake ABC transporter family permease subunit n=1 Tax=Nakamurella alba TaxID=2665158 RepID=A0A7K1FKP5_9ACTN|nr:iron chelate uptake ABC transporter family permease subunit [Nakamurella alba]